MKTWFTNQIEALLPPEASENTRLRNRYIGVYQSLFVLFVAILMAAPFYISLRHDVAPLELWFVVLAIAAPLIGILIIAVTKVLLAGMLGTTALVLVSLATFAYYTSGIQSFVTPWIMTILAVQSLFGSRKALVGTFVVLVITFASLFVLGQIGKLPVDTTPGPMRDAAFAMAIGISLIAIAWIGYVSLLSRERSKERLVKAKDKAEAANRAKTKFISSISHELNTPLNSIMGFSQLLASSPELKEVESLRKHTQRITDSGNLLIQLIDNVIHYSALDEKPMEREKSIVDVSGFLTDCLENVSHQARAKGLKLTNLANGNTYPRLSMEIMRCQEVMGIFLKNSVDYGKTGGEIGVGAEMINETLVRFSVTDDGPGIPQERHDEVFKPFHRLGMENSAVSGTGLGLALAQRLAEAIGGKIGFESKSGEGSTFWIDLPLEN